MTLDLTSLENAVAQLESALFWHNSDEASRDRKMQLHLRAGAIQAFGFTYELSFRMIKRYITMTTADPAAVDKMSFRNIMRKAFQIGLVQSEVSVWGHYRENRGTASHTYDEGKAMEVFASVPNFLSEAKYLLEQLQDRNDFRDTAG